METQYIFNMLFGVIGAGVAWWVNNVWIMVRSLQEQITELNVELGKNYVPRAELQDTFKRLFDSIEEIHKEVSHISRNQASVKALRELLGKDKE